MKLIKENIGPILILLIASALVVLAALPVANSDWAEGIRNDFAQRGGHEGHEEGEEHEGREGPSGVLMIVGPLIKVTILMGIGGALTALVLWVIGRISGPKAVPQKSQH